MDETIGPNKLFLEMAHQLAKNGIASLRYDKRTYIAKQTGKTEGLKTDIDNIVVNDAVKAIEVVSLNDSLKDVSIFVIGHSLGAHLSPRIAQKSGKLKGIILMAGNSRPLEELVVEQYKYLYARGGYSKAEKKEIKKIKKQAKNVKRLEKKLKKNPNMEVDLPLTNDTAFWLSLTRYNPVQTAKSISTPMLILQGSRDYQVTLTDFENWKKGLGSEKHANFIYYRDLNHLFILGKGKSYPEEYNRKGNISSIVITDISKWIDTIVNNKFKYGTFVH
jgi:alpha-beta hydrolase superfamily lysophospholipase